VLPFNEIEYQDMMKILEHIQTYSPSKQVEREFAVPGKTGEEATISIKDKQYAMTLVGGDQLTVARMRGAQRIRGNSENSEERFDGVLPVAEDWHAKICFMEVMEGCICIETLYNIVQ
jgi:L1 cell adhesion molecule like protein